MLKQLSILGLLTLLLIGCSDEASNQQNLADLEKELDKTAEHLAEKENELKTLYQQLEGTTEQEYIKVSKEDVPKLWNNPDTQLWKYMMDSPFAKENGWEQASTNWRKLDGEFDETISSPNQSWQSPGMLMLAFMTDVEVSYFLGQDVWEINSRIEFTDENNANGYILSYGWLDDSIAGSDIKLTMKKDNGFWYIEYAEEREQCYRGLDKTKGLCL